MSLDLRPRRDVVLGPGAIHVRFGGLLPVLAMRRRVDIPYERIRAVSAQPFATSNEALRVFGTAWRDGLHGLFRWHKRWLFASFEDPTSVLQLSTRPMRFVSQYVLGVQDPGTLRDEIAWRITRH